MDFLNNIYNNNQIIDKTANDLVSTTSYTKLISSDRFIRDVEHLINSSYWIDQLKSNKASGIGNQLFYQLNESEQFIKEFVKYCVNIKRVFLRDLLLKQSKEKDSLFLTTSTTVASNLIQFNSNLGEFIDLNNNNILKENQNNILVKLPIEFLIESIFLALLDLEEYIGNISEIASKLIIWFPEFQKCIQFHLKQIIESIMNSTPCYKRLMESNKSQQANKPIILGKRLYKWSINQNYLKSFIRYFYKCAEKKNNSSLTNEISSQLSSENTYLDLKFTDSNLKQVCQKPIICFNSLKFNSLFSNWKLKVDQFKLLLHLKHSSKGYSWHEPFLTSTNKFILNKIDFMKIDFMKIDCINDVQNNNNNINNNNNNNNNNLNNTTLSNINLNSANQRINKIRREIIMNNETQFKPKINKIERKLNKKEKKYLKTNKITLNQTNKSDKIEVDIVYNKQEDLLNQKETYLLTDLDQINNLGCHLTNDFNNHQSKSAQLTDQIIYENSISNQNSSSYFNLLTIPSLSVTFSSNVSNYLNHQNMSLNMIENGASSSCVEQFLTREEEEEFRVVTSDISIVEHDKFIYF